MSSVDAIVLAGGASRRMGTDKTNIIIEGRTLLQRSIDAVLLAGAERIIVVGQRGEPDVHRAGVTAIVDSFPGSGPLGGFLDGLRALRTPPDLSPSGIDARVVLLVAADHPDHAPNELRFLAVQLEQAPPETMAVIPVVDGRDQVLHAAFRPAVLVRLEESFGIGELSLHRALRQHPTIRIERTGTVASSYLDVDDPAQLEAYRNARAGRRDDTTG